MLNNGFKFAQVAERTLDLLVFSFIISHFMSELQNLPGILNNTLKFDQVAEWTEDLFVFS